MNLYISLNELIELIHKDSVALFVLKKLIIKLNSWCSIFRQKYFIL
jgi:hypothetical protein